MLPHQYGGFGDPAQPRTINVTTSIEVPEEETLPETISEKTKVSGTTWAKLKEDAMKEEYKEAKFFVSDLTKYS